MKLSIEPTRHDSIYNNGEDMRGHRDWLEHPSASVEFDAEDDYDDIFSRLCQLLVTVGWTESKITAHFEAYSEKLKSQPN